MSDAKKVLVEMSEKDFNKITHLIENYDKKCTRSRNDYHRKHPEPKKKIYTHRKQKTDCPKMVLVTLC